jgi:hypothetical protein
MPFHNLDKTQQQQQQYKQTQQQQQQQYKQTQQKSIIRNVVRNDVKR